MAFGVLNLSPWEFDQMTPAEFQAKVRGFYWTQERKRKDMAWAVAVIANYCGHLKRGHRVSLNKLYKPSNMDPNNPYYRSFIG
jgi:hypothetical protein